MTKRRGIPDKADTTCRGLEAPRGDHTATGLLLRAVAVSRSRATEQLAPTKKGIKSLPNRLPLVFSQEPVSTCDTKVDRHRWRMTVGEDIKEGPNATGWAGREEHLVRMHRKVIGRARGRWCHYCPLMLQHTGVGRRNRRGDCEPNGESFRRGEERE